MIENFDKIKVGDKIRCYSSRFPEYNGMVCNVIKAEPFDEKQHYSYKCDDNNVVIIEIKNFLHPMMINAYVWKENPNKIMDDFELVNDDTCLTIDNG